MVLLLSRAAKATKGYAYLVQLVGYSIWQRANLHRAKSAIVSERDVTEGIALAEARFHGAVHEPMISGLGLNDIKFLLAMCEDKQQSKSSEIATFPRLHLLYEGASILVFGRRRYAMKFSTSATIESFSLGSERATMSVIAASALPSTRSLSPSLRTPFLSRK